MDVIAELEDALSGAAARVDGAGSVEELETVESSLLGKNSVVGSVRRAMGGLEPSQRPVVGARLNEVTTEIDRLIAQRRVALSILDEQHRLTGDRIDVTLESVNF
ncbi:MAG TPA: hypothetical protein VI193_07905, partial [Acidimicrobiia bacterium]